MSITATLSRPSNPPQGAQPPTLDQQIEDCYAQHELIMAAHAADLPRLVQADMDAFMESHDPLGPPPAVQPVDVLVAAHLAVVKGKAAERRKFWFLRDRPNWLDLVLYPTRNLFTEAGEKVPLKLTLEEHRKLMLAGVMPIHADARKLTRMERSQVRRIRRGVILNPSGQIVPLCKHKNYGDTARGLVAFVQPEAQAS